MPTFTPDELAGWSKGIWTRTPSAPAGSVVHDSRDLKPGGLYVALPGARVDGHDFLDACAKSGAMGAVCARGRAHPGLPCLEVDDPGAALCDLARGYRRELRGVVIGITGSAGKTTVKDLLAAMLARKGPTRRTRGNWNNQIGLPLSLLSMERDDAYGVFEAGMNARGEIAFLAEILRPDRAIITSIGEAHLENLGSVAAIAEEKTDLFAALPAEGMAVLDLDSEWIDLIRRKCAADRRVSVSMSTKADLTGEALEGRNLKITDWLRDEVFEVETPLPGGHMRRNVLQAVAMARDLGLSADEIREGLSSFTGAPMRWREERIGGRLFINDAYNANPLSMRSSLRTFAELERPGEKWLVIGGMSELGAAEEAHHRGIGELAETLCFDGVVGVGRKARWYLEEIGSGGYAAADAAEAARLLRERTAADAAVLVKASRSEGLERVIDEFRNLVDREEKPA